MTFQKPCVHHHHHKVEGSCISCLWFQKTLLHYNQDMFIAINLLISSLIFALGFRDAACSVDSSLKTRYSELEEAAILVEDARNYEDNTNKWGANCNKYRCFNSLQCEINSEKQLLYYVYPPLTFLDKDENLLYATKSMTTLEYWKVLQTILSSSRLTLNPDRACLFVPSIDLTWLDLANSSLISALYENLPYWRSVDGKPGTNHLVISLNPTQDLNQIQNAIGRAIFISTNHDTWTLRPEFDFSIPIINGDSQIERQERQVQWKLLFTQYSSIKGRQIESIANLEKLMQNDLLVLGHRCRNRDNKYVSCDRTLQNSTLDQIDKTVCRCSKDEQLDFTFPQVLASSQFCLIMHLRDFPPLGDSSQYLLGQTMRHGCVPIVTNDLSLPYSTFVNWNEISIALTNEFSLESIVSVISSIDAGTYQKMSSRAQEIWSNYFQTPSQIASNIMYHYDSFVYPRILVNKSPCNQ